MADIQKLYKGWVTHVIDPGSFWMQIGTDNGFDEFRVYQASVDDYINTSSDSLIVPASALTQGDCVVVKNHSGHKQKQFKWRRARVSRVEGNSVDVFFVDYGYTEIINIQDIRSIQVPVFEYLSPQAIRVELAGIKPLSRSWTSRAVSKFEEKVLHKSLIVSVLEVDESQSLFVALYRRGDNGDWYSVTHTMLDEDLGLPNDYTLGFEKYINHDVVERVLLQMNQEESADVEEDQEEVQISSNDEEEKEAFNSSLQSTIKDGEEDVEIWDDPVNNSSQTKAKDGEKDVEIWDDPVNNSLQTKAKDEEEDVEVWDDPVRDEEDEIVENVDSVWKDAIEDLEEGSSEEEEETVASVNANKSNSATGFVNIQQASEGDKEKQLITHENVVTSLSQETTNTVGIPQFNIKPLSQTRAVSANELQVEIEERTQKKRVRDMQKDLHRCKEDFDEGFVHSPTIHWGRSDSQVGQPHIADDGNIQESISEELHNRFLSEVNEMEALGQSLNRKFRDIKEKFAESSKSNVAEAVKPITYPAPKPTVSAVVSPKKFTASQPELGSSINDKCRPPLTEEESYHLEMKILEILINKKNETPEMLRVQLHDIIPAEKALQGDLMTVVMTAVLESIIRHKCFDPAFALTILETYTGADAFLTVLKDTLKVLKDKFVKITKHPQKCNHEDFASLLAMLFIQSQCWASSICESVQKYALSTVDKWIIFNKKRQHDQDAAINTELIYLECVSVFMKQTRAILSDQFPEQVHFWLDEMREKLLHDLSHRPVRAVLLDILLHNVAGDGNPALFRPHRSSVSVSTQTGTGSGRNTPDMSLRTSQGPFYKAPRGTLYPRRDPFTPHDFQENSSKLPESFDSLSLNDFKSTYEMDSQVPKSETNADSMHCASSGGQETLQPCSRHVIAEELKDDSYGNQLSSQQNINEILKEPEEPNHQALGLIELSNVKSETSNPSTQEIPQTTESSELIENIESDEAESLANRITYSPEVLKAMNPMKGIRIRASQLKEPFELKHVFCRIEDDAPSSEKENSSYPNPSHIPSQRYTGDVDSPKELSLLGYNVEAYTPKRFDGNTFKDSNSSLNMNNSSCPDSNNSILSDMLETSTPEECTHSRNVSLVEDWTHGINLEANDQSNSNSAQESADTDKAGEESALNPKWPDNFFRNAPAGKKKKKAKFRPLEDFLDEGKTFGVDEPEQKFNDDDEFSEAALQMYIELEKEGEEREFLEARVIHGPKLISSTRSKPSLFADARKGQSVVKSTPWVPGKRKCTRCGSETHIVSDCTEGTINNMNDMSFMF